MYHPGRMPHVTLVFRNGSPQLLSASRDDIKLGLLYYMHYHLYPAWGVSCGVHFGEPSGDTWELYFLDDADQATVLGLHDVDPADGLPRGFVNLSECQRLAVHPFTVACHELAEMLTDPMGHVAVQSPRGRWAALEICDPVQGETFPIMGLPAADFCWPGWFGLPQTDPHRYDECGRCAQPWEILPGGYLPVQQNGAWTNLFGSPQREALFAQEDRRLHRTERRSRRPDLTALAWNVRSLSHESIVQG